MINKFKSFLDKHSQKILWLAIFFYCLIFSLVSVWKYNHYLYNGLDLAIYNQTFYNTSFGRWFELSIHPPTYLADHFEPLILPLSFIYSFWRDPRLLLVLQSLILALIAWPVYLITKNVFEKYPLNKFYGLVAGLLILLNPLVQNINLFEYHMLVWAIFFLLFAFYFYQKRVFRSYLIFIILALFVREDVPLIVFMFGPLYLFYFYRQHHHLKIKKRDWLWFLAPIILSLFWFFTYLKGISYFNPDSHYKFLQYYSWLGNSWTGIIIGIFRHPLKLIIHLFSIGNLEMILGFLFSFFLLPLASPYYLLLATGVFCQIVLGAPGGSELILSTHYSSLFLPALIISSIYGAKSLLEKRRKNLFLEFKKSKLIFNPFYETFHLLLSEKKLLIIMTTLTIIFFSLSFGPLSGVISEYFKNQPEEKIIKDELLKKIPADATIIASYAVLPQLSSRQNIYALNYAFIGKKQMSEKPYPLPSGIDYLVVDFDDFLAFQFQYPNDYSGGYQNLKKILQGGNFGAVGIFDEFAVFKQNEADEINFVQIIKKDFTQNEGLVLKNNEIEYLGTSRPVILRRTLAGHEIKFFETTLSWQASQKIKKNYQLKLSLENKNGKIIYEKIYPLAYGLYPTSAWQLDEKVATTYRFLIPKDLAQEKLKVWLNLVDLKGSTRLNKIRSVFNYYEKQNQIGEKILLTVLNP